MENDIRMGSKKIEIFQDVLNQYESEEIKNFCMDMLENSPQNFWSLATKNYDFAGGLIVLTLLGCFLGNFLLKESTIEKPKKRDCIRAAVMFRYVYPTEITNRIVEHDIKLGLRKYIADLISNCRKQETPEQKIVYQCYNPNIDYIQFFNNDLKDKITDVALPDPETFFFSSEYKYPNFNFWLVYELDRDYLYWLRDSSKYVYIEEPLRTYLWTELEKKNG